MFWAKLIDAIPVPIDLSQLRTIYKKKKKAMPLFPGQGKTFVFHLSCLYYCNLLYIRVSQSCLALLRLRYTIFNWCKEEGPYYSSSLHWPIVQYKILHANTTYCLKIAEVLWPASFIYSKVMAGKRGAVFSQHKGILLLNDHIIRNIAIQCCCCCFFTLISLIPSEEAVRLCNFCIHF